MNILKEIAEKTKERVAKEKQEKTLEEIKQEAFAINTDTGFPFEKALKEEKLSFICEVKKASPSKGIIIEDFPYLDIAKEYEAGGASAVSVLTEPFYFQGSDKYLKEIIKDSKSFLEVAHGLGLSALVEAHSREEVERALKAGARIVGVNNRDLRTFKVDINNSIRLRPLVPDDILFVSESGIKGKEDIKKLSANGTDGVLIGETMMRAGAGRANVLKELAAAAG